jgi:hypothetical protein
VDRKKIALNYIKSWFFVDIFSSLPLSIILLVIEMDNTASVMSFRFFKLAKILRIYRLIALVKLVRVFRHQKFVEYLISKVNLSPDT